MTVPPPTPKRPLKMPGRGADRGELAGSGWRARQAVGVDRAAILEAVSGEPETATGARRALLEPLRADPARTAILTDFDGTLAPIVERPERGGAAGRRARGAARADRALRAGRLRSPDGAPPEARRSVGLDRIAYAGNHGLELLMPGESEPTARPLAGAARARGGGRSSPRSTPRSSTAAGCGSRTRARSRRSTGAAPRTSGAPRRAPARSPPRPAGPGSNRAGAARCWSCGRSGAAARTPRWPRSWPTDSIAAVVYARRRSHRLDAFRRLRELREEGELVAVVCVGVLSPEAPPELAEESDLDRRWARRLARDPRAGWRRSDALHRPAARHRLPHRRRGHRPGGISAISAAANRARRPHRRRSPGG